MTEQIAKGKANLKNNEDRKESIADTVWIFGYGSLVWNPEFPFHQKAVGFIHGYKRG